MNNFRLLFCVLFVFTFSCKKDKALKQFNLFYDSQNVDAPLREPGNHYFGVLFNNNTLSEYTGQSIKEIAFYTKDTPDQTTLRIYRTSDDLLLTDQLLYSENVDVKSESWNYISLSESDFIDIDNSSQIFISIRTAQTTSQSVMGCDGGPITSGANLYSTDNVNYYSFIDLEPGVNVNWNIRAFVD